MKNHLSYVAFRMATLLETIAEAPQVGRITHFAIRQYQGLTWLIWSDSNQGDDCFHVERPACQWREFLDDVLERNGCAGAFDSETGADAAYIQLEYMNVNNIQQ